MLIYGPRAHYLHLKIEPMNTLIHDHRKKKKLFDQNYQGLLSGNSEFVASSLKKDKDFFEKLASGQHPEILWIGCADSRVPASQITSSGPGDIFEHRNIANVCLHSDINLLSVLDYSVNSLKVKHVIVAGHYRCGGVRAALKGEPVGFIDHWLLHIRDVYQQHREEIDQLSNQTQKWDRLVELNVLQQVNNLSRAPIIDKAWADGANLVIHGWIIDLESGFVKEMYQSDTHFRKEGKVWLLEKDSIIA